MRGLQSLHKIAAGVLWDFEMQNHYNEYVRLRETAKKQVLSTIRIKQVKDIKVTFVQSSPFIQTSLFSEEILQRTQADLAIFYSSEGKVRLDEVTRRYHVVTSLLTYRKGGGHKFVPLVEFFGVILQMWKLSYKS